MLCSAHSPCPCLSTPGLSKEQLGQLEERLAERVRTEV